MLGLFEEQTRKNNDVEGVRGKEGGDKIRLGAGLDFYSGWNAKSLEGVELRRDRAAVLRTDCWQAEGEEEIMAAPTGKE